MFLESNIYGHFGRHLLTLDKSLELELDTVHRQAPSPFSHIQPGSRVCYLE